MTDLPALIHPNGVRMEMTNCDGDDFITSHWSLKATHPDGPSLRWKLPERLMLKSEIWDIAVPELLAALDEHAELMKRVKAQLTKEAKP